MGKGYASAVLTASDSKELQRFFAVEIGYSTPLRVCNLEYPVQVNSTTFYPFPVDVLEPPVRPEGSQLVQITISNGDLTGVGTLTGRLSELDIAQDSRELTLKIWECTFTSDTAHTDTLVFDGVVDEFSASEDTGTCRITGAPVEQIGSRPGSNYCMASCRWRKFGGDDCQYSGSATTCTRTLTDCRRKVTEAVFDGTGLDKMTSGGSHTGTTIRYFIIEITATNQFKWSPNNGSTWTTGVTITGATQTLVDGVTVKFEETSGYTIGDQWTFQANWEDYFGNLIHAPVAGTTIEVNGTAFQIPDGGQGGYYHNPVTPPPPDPGGGHTQHPGPPNPVATE